MKSSNSGFGQLGRSKSKDEKVNQDSKAKSGVGEMLASRMFLKAQAGKKQASKQGSK